MKPQLVIGLIGMLLALTLCEGKGCFHPIRYPIISFTLNICGILHFIPKQYNYLFNHSSNKYNMYCMRKSLFASG